MRHKLAWLFVPAEGAHPTAGPTTTRPPDPPARSPTQVKEEAMSDRDDRPGGAPDDYSWLFSDEAPGRDGQPGRSPLGPAGRATAPAGDDDDPASATTQAIPRTPGASGPTTGAGAAATQMLPTAPTSSPRPRPQPAPTRASAGSPPPGSPPPGSPPPGSRPGGFAPPPSPPRARRRGRLVRRIVILVLVAMLAFFVVTPIWAWNQIARVPAEQSSADTSGTNILVVGSDKRSDLTAAERKALGTGNAAGQRTDSIMLMHLPAKGEPTLVSLPRDSYVPIPGHNRNKINAAFAFGGPTLLVKTVEAATGLHIDAYVEVGFGGFVNVVDSVGGVDMCLPKAMKDKDAHIDLKAGCQVLDGTQALGFVRARHSQAKGDLDRVDNQRKLLAAITQKALSPATLLPWRYYGLLGAGAKSLSIGDDTSLREMIGFARGMRAVSSGNGTTTTVPIANANYSTSAGSAVLWDRDKALAFFKKLKEN
jgi:LCP family protein required for cell wall assembly